MANTTLPCGTLPLNDGTSIPRFGLGCYRSAPGEEAYTSVLLALKHGYRLIDTAELYANEADVGRAIRDSKIPRNEIFVVTKFWVGSGHGYDKVINAFQRSLDLLEMDYIDLYLLHSPCDGDVRRLDSWKALEFLKQEGKVRSIGVSNYGVHHLKELLGNCVVPPSVNQIELSPFLTHDDIVTFCNEHQIVVQAYSPLTKGRKLKDPTILAISSKYHVTAAQILLRWSYQRNFVVIPKSTKENRIIENGSIFHFEISEEDMSTLNTLDEYLTTGWDPTVGK
eukprot:c7340_g1_i1.p1 GENE.c7340_g1_i1~~c7340_g1_i1.p1  ORF type:complete len:309 (+),score=88.99 c7340_g1_i1:85-927(+)